MPPPASVEALENFVYAVQTAARGTLWSTAAVENRLVWPHLDRGYLRADVEVVHRSAPAAALAGPPFEGGGPPSRQPALAPARPSSRVGGSDVRPPSPEVQAPRQGAPSWDRLQTTIALTPAQRLGQRCPITLDDLDELAEPVAVRSGEAVQVFEYRALLRHLAVDPTHPLTRQPLSTAQLVRVTDAHHPGPS